MITGLPHDKVVSLAYEWAARFVSLSEQHNAMTAAAASNPSKREVTEAEMMLESDLRCAVLVLSVIAIVSPADVSRDTCVRLVTVLLQMVDTSTGLVRAVIDLRLGR